MTDLYSKARGDVASMLGYNLDDLAPEQALRVDVASALRVLLDNQSGRLVRGESLDARELLMASEALSRLLPTVREPAAGPREDPREVMWRIYRTMRERGQINLKPLPASEELEAENERLKTENERLKAELGGGPAAAFLTSASPPREKVITPALGDIVPPGEQGETYAGKRLTPDDLNAMRPKPLIDAAATSAAPAPRPQTWDDTPNGKAWQAWRDAGGGGGFDRWSNRNF